jgi:ankyrin repeat protein
MTELKNEFDAAQKPDVGDLIEAIQLAKIDDVKALIEQEVDVNGVFEGERPPLLEAISCGNCGMAKLLIEGGADVNARNQHGETPLMKAVETGILGMVHLLLDKGASANQENEHGAPVLNYAVSLSNAYAEREQIIRLLAENGADIESKFAFNGRTAQESALIMDHKAAAQLLGELAEEKRQHAHIAGKQQRMKARSRLRPKLEIPA